MLGMGQDQRGVEILRTEKIVTLRSVRPAEPSPVEKVLQRLRRAPRPDGMLQCNRCGGRTVLNTACGVIVKNGRRHPGTKIDTEMCANCWKQGILSPMQPKLQAVD
jgi:hypothetical protein